MSYQTRNRRCRKCQRMSTHWRELPDLPSDWVRALDELPLYLWKRLGTGWNCRACLGVPKGPLDTTATSRRRGRERSGG